MKTHEVVEAGEWVRARKALLEKEKEFTRARDSLAAARRELPWKRVDKPYVFDTPTGEKTLGELFAGRSQLVVYHFMFAPDWTAGCKNCSFWADGFERMAVHLAARDVTLAAISRAPLAKLLAFEKRLGWSFTWVSSGRTEFNYDYGVSFDPARGPQEYNYEPKKGAATDLPGISVFHRDPGGVIHHTYSTYGRGIDMMNPAYQWLDLVPKGRDEENLPFSMQWLRLRDEYGSGGTAA
jgi:predicted dithiol-disulfide oxidoreductase (DUF899 family)